MNFFRTPFFLPWLSPSLVWRIKTNQKKIYLTFDDGPVPGPTEFVLHTLNNFNIKATFFCIGDNVRKHPEIFNKIIGEGHAIGNHTFNHINGWKFPVEKYLENILLCERQFQETNLSDGQKLFRPPYGRITQKQIRSMNHYKIIMWDVLTYDYRKDFSEEKCLKHSIKAVRPGSIVVFHDSLKAERNLTYVLPNFIEHFLSKGYSFDSIQDTTLLLP